MLKPPMTKFRSDLSVSLRDIAEKLVPAKLKPKVAVPYFVTRGPHPAISNRRKRCYRRAERDGQRRGKQKTKDLSG